MKRILLLFIVALPFFNARALTLDQARTLAMENYPLVREYNLINLTEQYTLENAAKSWLPQVEAGADATWQTSVAAYPDVLKEMLSQRGLDIQGMGRWQWRAQVDVRQMIWDGGRIKASRNVARRQAEEDRIADQVEEYQLRNRIDDIYFGILLMKEQCMAIQSTIDLLQSNLDRVNSLVRNGAAMQCDADAIEAELLSSQQQHTSVESSLKAYLSILEIYIGEKAHEKLEMPDAIIVPAGSTPCGRPEQRLMTARQETFVARQQEVRTESMPQIGAFAQGYFGYPGMNFMDAMMNRHPSFNAMLGISLSWKIGSLYTRKNKIRLLETASERVEVGRRVFEFNTSIQVAQQRREIERLREISTTDSSIVELKQRVRNASEARLREGIVEPTDLLLRITDEKNAIISANTHRIQYLKAIYQLQTTLCCE